MGILSDNQIKAEVGIHPFAENEKREGTISYGVSSYGYDVRLGNKFKIFTPVYSTVIDPKAFDEKAFVPIETGVAPDNYIVIPPNSFALGYSFERIQVPRDMLAICLGKSTYARCGIVVNVTPLEPEWEGYVTIEISNTAPLPAKIYAGEGIMQVLFIRSDMHRQNIEEVLIQLRDNLKDTSEGIAGDVERLLYDSSCETSYADKKGKYQGQSAEVVLPKVEPAIPKIRKKKNSNKHSQA